MPNTRKDKVHDIVKASEKRGQTYKNHSYPPDLTLLN
jgi:hypothetical protein